MLHLSSFGHREAWSFNAHFATPQTKTVAADDAGSY